MIFLSLEEVNLGMSSQIRWYNYVNGTLYVSRLVRMPTNTLRLPDLQKVSVTGSPITVGSGLLDPDGVANVHLVMLAIW